MVKKLLSLVYLKGPSTLRRVDVTTLTVFAVCITVLVTVPFVELPEVLEATELVEFENDAELLVVGLRLLLLLVIGAELVEFPTVVVTVVLCADGREDVVVVVVTVISTEV